MPKRIYLSSGSLLRSPNVKSRSNIISHAVLNFASSLGALLPSQVMYAISLSVPSVSDLKDELGGKSTKAAVFHDRGQDDIEMKEMTMTYGAKDGARVLMVLALNDWYKN